MRKTLVIAVLVAMVGVPALPAQAAPWNQSWLPDADLYCEQEGVLAAVGEWVGNPSAGTLWIAGGDFAGHYVTVRSAHYYAPGLAYEPFDDVAGLYPLGERSFGKKAGLGDRVHCQVVSRFDLDGYEDDFTIIAPLELANLR
jgi:hypothetical protein